MTPSTLPKCTSKVPSRRLARRFPPPALSGAAVGAVLALPPQLPPHAASLMLTAVRPMPLPAPPSLAQTNLYHSVPAATRTYSPTALYGRLAHHLQTLASTTFKSSNKGTRTIHTSFRSPITPPGTNCALNLGYRLLAYSAICRPSRKTSRMTMPKTPETTLRNHVSSDLPS